MNCIRIMLIDDEPTVLSDLQRVLRQHPPAPRLPCAVEIHTSPLAAIEAARERTIDVVVCGHRMPELDGVETLRRLKAVQPQTGRILLADSREFDTVADAIETRRLRLDNADLADQLRIQCGLLTKQDAELRRLEAQWPGITRVEWEDDGSVCMTQTDVLITSFGRLPRS